MENKIVELEIAGSIIIMNAAMVKSLEILRDTLISNKLFENIPSIIDSLNHYSQQGIEAMDMYKVVKMSLMTEYPREISQIEAIDRITRTKLNFLEQIFTFMWRGDEIPQESQNNNNLN